MESLEDRRLMAALWVNSNMDNNIYIHDNFLTLREAVMLHNGTIQVSQLTQAEKAQIKNGTPGSGLDTIHLEQAPQKIFDLNSALPNLKGNLTIMGAGPDKTTVERNPQNFSSYFGIFCVDANATVTFSNMTIANGSSKTARGGGIRNRGTLTTVNNCILSYDWATVAGGGIYNDVNSKMIVNDSQIYRCMSMDMHEGGGIYNEGTMELHRSRVEYCGAYSGGGIYNTGKLNIFDSTFTGNKADAYGGAICNKGALDVSNTGFLSNSVSSILTAPGTVKNGGGAIYSQGANGVHIHNSCQFKENSANNNRGIGGAIYCSGGNLVIDTGVNYFYHNTAKVDGGAIYSDDWTKITGAKFDVNRANNQGGAIYASGFGFQVDQCSFGGNDAAFGGAVCNDTKGSSNSMSIRNSTFQYNTAGIGGAIANYGPMTIDTCTIYHNQARSNGGGVYNLAGWPGWPYKLTIVNTSIDANSANGSGGGIWSQGIVSLSSSTISNCCSDLVHGNGGGLFNYTNSKMDLTNCTVWGNSAHTGGGIYSFGDLDLLFDTIARNITPNVNGIAGVCEGPENGLSAHLHAHNTLIAENKYLDQNGQLKSRDLYTSAVDSVFTNCLIGNGSFTGANLSQGNNLYGTYLNPLDAKISDLADNGGSTKTCALHADSPAYKAGSAEPNVKKDQRGMTRKDTPDIGAYELHLYQ
jgi:predicted outer membrane repeat protein